MNEGYWQLRAASRNYFDSHQITTRLSNRMKALQRQGHNEPFLDQQHEVAEKGRKEIGKLLTKLYKQLAPEAIVQFQQETAGLGELYVAQLVGVVGDFKTYTEAWWESTEDSGYSSDDSHLDNGHQPSASYTDHATSQPGSASQRNGVIEDFSQSTPASRESAEVDSSHGNHDSQPSDEKTEKRVLIIGAVRTCGVRDIWAYCGHGDASRRRRKGMTQEEVFKAGNPLAKSIVHMMADFSVRLNGVPDKNGRPRAMSPYYPLYLRAKAAAKERHEDWTAGHAHNHALRLVGKAILKDLWRVQHGEPPVYGERTEWSPIREMAATPDLIAAGTGMTA